MTANIFHGWRVFLGQGSVRGFKHFSEQVHPYQSQDVFLRGPGLSFEIRYVEVIMYIYI